MLGHGPCSNPGEETLGKGLEQGRNLGWNLEKAGRRPGEERAGRKRPGLESGEGVNARRGGGKLTKAAKIEKNRKNL